MESPKDSRTSDRTISNMVGLAMKKEVSWTLVALFLEEMTSNLLKSKQVIKILLKELENLSLNADKSLNGTTLISEENQSEHEDNLEIDEIVFNPRKQATILDESNYS